MSDTFWVDHHADYAGRANSAPQDGWSSRRKLCCFLGFAVLAWSLILAPFLLLG